jgi:hypothetical protein
MNQKNAKTVKKSDSSQNVAQNKAGPKKFKDSKDKMPKIPEENS